MASVLTIPTYEGSGEAVHPDVIQVDGTYWMAMTPYPASENDDENPSILTSTDGTTWTVPAGLTNPIVAFPGGDEHNSDADLVHDGSSFHLFYRRTTEAGGDDAESIRTLASSDGVTWGSETTILSGNDRAAFLSPAVVKDGSTWKMWVVDAAASPNELHIYTSSSATGSWTKSATCTLPSSSDDIWHVDVVAHAGGFIGMFNYCDLNTSGTSAYLVTAVSNDGLTWRLHDTTIDPGGSVLRVYRGVLLFDAGDWRLWYSRHVSANEWQILIEEDPPMVALHPTPSALAGSSSAWPSLKL